MPSSDHSVSTLIRIDSEMRNLKVFSILCSSVWHLIYHNSCRNYFKTIAHLSPDFFIGSLFSDTGLKKKIQRFAMMDDLNSEIPSDLLLEARSILLTQGR